MNASQLRHFRAELVESSNWTRTSGRPAGPNNTRVHLFAVSERAKAYLEWRLKLAQAKCEPTSFGLMGVFGMIGYAVANNKPEAELAIRLTGRTFDACRDEFASADEMAELELPVIPDQA